MVAELAQGDPRELERMGLFGLKKGSTDILTAAQGVEGGTSGSFTKHRIILLVVLWVSLCAGQDSGRGLCRHESTQSSP